MTENEQTTVKCLICGISFCSLSAHLKVHGIDTYEYKRRYPNTPTVAPDTIKALSNANREKWNDPSYRESVSKGVSATLLGHSSYVRSDEIRQQTSTSLLGHEVREKTRNQISRVRMGHSVSKETRQLQSVGNIGKIRSDDARQNISRGVKKAFQSDSTIMEKASKARVGKKQSLETCQLKSDIMKEVWKDPEYSKHMYEMLKHTPNDSEIRLHVVLDKHFPGEWKYVGDGLVNLGGRLPDFINIDGKKQVIEMFGIHWHDPYYFPNRPSEEELVVHYKKYGFDCLVIWEYDVYDEPLVIEKVKAFKP